MADFKSFFMQNALPAETEKLPVSKRFIDADGKPILWEVKAITEDKNNEVRNLSHKKVKAKSGKYESELDPMLYMANLVAECVIYPDLKNAALQDSYGVTSAQSLLQKMLLPGEYAELGKKVQEINGFDEDPNEVFDEVKN